jgi:hypothetical protein
MLTAHPAIASEALSCAGACTVTYKEFRMLHTSLANQIIGIAAMVEDEEGAFASVDGRWGEAKSELAYQSSLSGSIACSKSAFHD